MERWMSATLSNTMAEIKRIVSSDQIDAIRQVDLASLIVGIAAPLQRTMPLCRFARELVGDPLAGGAR
jgi:hypothetical protein